MSKDAYKWEASTGERVFSATTLTTGFSEQIFEYSDTMEE
jgi:hypothetical protein